RKEPKRRHQDNHTQNVNSYAGIVQARNPAHAVVVDPSMREKNESIHKQDGRVFRRQPKERNQKERAAVVDSCDHSNKSNNVEPGCEPGPGRSSQLSRPVIHGAGSRDGRSKLSHAQRNQKRPDSNQRPTQSHLQRPTHEKSVIKKRYRAGENGDDRKRKRKVGKAAYGTEKFLGIAKAF